MCVKPISKDGKEYIQDSPTVEGCIITNGKPLAQMAQKE
jgi:hypothetical protein